MAMSRYYQEIAYRPRSRYARLSWWLARFAVLVSLIAIILIRFNLVDTGGALVALFAGFAIAALAFVLSIVAFVRIWREDHRGFGKAVAGCLVSLLALSVPVSLQAFAILRPGINAISSDTVDIPPFSRTRQAFEARDGTLPVMPQQAEQVRMRLAYPDIVTLVLNVEPKSALGMIRETARSQGWTEIASLSPGGRFGDGHFDAIARTTLLQLPIDITLRIRPVAGGTRIDIRCVSRYGNYDFFDNASLVRNFMSELSDTASGEEP